MAQCPQRVTSEPVAWSKTVAISQAGRPQSLQAWGVGVEGGVFVVDMVRLLSVVMHGLVCRGVTGSPDRQS